MTAPQGEKSPHVCDQYLSDPHTQPRLLVGNTSPPCDAALRDEKVASDCVSFIPNDLPREGRRLAHSRSIRGMISLVLGFLLLSFCGYRWIIKSEPVGTWLNGDDLLPTGDNGGYSSARHFDGVRIKEVDHHILPGGLSDVEGQRRLVFIGDIHGCKKELKALLNKLVFNEATDHLVTVGDTISKGPDNAGVLDELIRLKADSVRGNHEDALLNFARTASDILPLDSQFATSQKASKDAALLKQLSTRHMQYLKDMPLMLRIPALPSASPGTRKDKTHISEEILVIHAGLVPDLPLDKQNPYFVMNMRSIDHHTLAPSATSANKERRWRPWFTVWNEYNDRVYRTVKSWRSEWWPITLQKSTSKRKPQVVIYGHNSKQGLQIHRFSKGLDSGCVGGGRLSALVLSANGTQKIFSVGCRNYKE